MIRKKTSAKNKRRPSRKRVLPALPPSGRRALSAMPGVGYSAEQNLRDRGIRSLLELARSDSGRAMQAQSLLTDNPIFRPYELPAGCAYLDIESMTFHQDVFLIGILYEAASENNGGVDGIWGGIGGNSDIEGAYTYVPLYADTERKLAGKYNRFVKKYLPDCHTIYHWSSYDATNLRRMNCRYIGRLHDMLVDFRRACLLPVSSYSIKDVADYCGYSGYEQTDVSAIECGHLWNQYVRQGDKNSLERMLKYNRTDCEAMAAVYEWYRRYKWPSHTTH